MCFFKKKQNDSIDVNDLKEAQAYLEENPKVLFNPYPAYDGRIFTVLNSLGFDNMFMDKSEKIKDKPIEKMSLGDLKTMYSFIVRSEKFCDGSIAGYVEDGTLAKMVKREIELLEWYNISTKYFAGIFALLFCLF